MATTIKLGQEVTVDGTAVEYLIDETNVTLQKPFQSFLITMTTGNSGTIQFSVGETPPSGQKTWATATSFTIDGVQNGLFNLWAKGSASGQKFTIT